MKRKYNFVTKPGPTMTCNVSGCDAAALRSLSLQEYERYLAKSGLQLKSDREKRVYACEKHYKMLNGKDRKKAKELEFARRRF